jgi:hypothetical protein
MQSPDVKISECAENAAPTINPAPIRMTSLPTNNICKMEKFDEEIMRQMLVDDRIPLENRKKLSEYYKHSRHTPSVASVIYTLSKSNAAKGIGRLYPMNGLGLANVRSDVRGPLLSKYYWDVDMENCHYNIALKLAKDNGLPHQSIAYYCNHRDECLALVNSDRKIAKVAFLKVAYGGDITIYREDYIDYGGNVHPEGDALLQKLKLEMTILAQHLWEKNPSLHKHKCGKENMAIEKQANSRYVLMSHLLQDIEKKLLLTLDAYLQTQERVLGVLIHDGGCVEKLDGEMEFPNELLLGGSTAIAQETGYVMRLAVKPMRNDYTPPVTSSNQYARMKADFEKNHFLIGPLLNRITVDGVRQEYKNAEAVIITAPLMCPELDTRTLEMKMVPFYPKWLKDPNRKSYERVDFIPNRKDCPESVYNLFQGFAGEKVSEDVGLLAPEERLTLIKPIVKHIAVLCNGDPSFFIAVLAQLLQHPEIKSDMGLFLRDKGCLLNEGGGIGKDLIMNFFGIKILGDKYYYNMDNNAEMYNAFNSMLEGKLLVYVQEADSRNNHNNIDVLKSLITKRQATINKKHVAQYSVKDLSRWVFASNNANPLPIKQGDRRFAIWDVSTEYRNNREYFDTLNKAMDDPRVIAAFYQYLMDLPVWKTPIEFQINRPITDAYIDIRQMNAAPHLKWLRHCAISNTLPERCTARSLYQSFKTWYASVGREPERIISETMFGKLMKEVLTDGDDSIDFPAAEAVRVSGGIEYRFDVPKLIDGLERLHILKKGEVVWNPEGLCLIAEDSE